MSAKIKKTATGYLITTTDGCNWEKYSMSAAMVFCRLLGFKPILEITL